MFISINFTHLCIACITSRTRNGLEMSIKLELSVGLGKRTFDCIYVLQRQFGSLIQVFLLEFSVLLQESRFDHLLFWSLSLINAYLGFSVIWQNYSISIDLLLGEKKNVFFHSTCNFVQHSSSLNTMWLMFKLNCGSILSSWTQFEFKFKFTRKVNAH